jgi:hypothetical protein
VGGELGIEDQFHRQVAGVAFPEFRELKNLVGLFGIGNACIA